MAFEFHEGEQLAREQRRFDKDHGSDCTSKAYTVQKGERR